MILNDPSSNRQQLASSFNWDPREEGDRDLFDFFGSIEGSSAVPASPSIDLTTEREILSSFPDNQDLNPLEPFTESPLPEAPSPTPPSLDIPLPTLDLPFSLPLASPEPMNSNKRKAALPSVSKSRPQKKRKTKKGGDVHKLPPASEIPLNDWISKNQAALVALDSISFEEYISVVEKRKTEFTPKEAAQLKDIRRKIRNRESARNSRQKKKDKLEGLQSQVNELRDHNAALREEISSLDAQKQALHNELAHIHKVISQNPQIRQLFNGIQSGLDYVHAVVKQNGLDGNVRSGLVLMVILFAFGLCFPSMPIFASNRGGVPTRANYARNGRFIEAMATSRLALPTDSDTNHTENNGLVVNLSDHYNEMKGSACSKVSHRHRGGCAENEKSPEIARVLHVPA